MKQNQPWNKKKIQILQDFYEYSDIEYIKEQLPNRNWDSDKRLCSVLF